MTFFVTLDGVQGAILTYDLRIVLSFDHRVCFLMGVFGEERLQEGEKRGFIYYAFQVCQQFKDRARFSEA